MCHREDQTKNGHQEIKYELPAFYFILRVGKRRFEQEKKSKGREETAEHFLYSTVGGLRWGSSHSGLDLVHRVDLPFRPAPVQQQYGLGSRKAWLTRMESTFPFITFSCCLKFSQSKATSTTHQNELCCFLFLGLNTLLSSVTWHLGSSSHNLHFTGNQWECLSSAHCDLKMEPQRFSVLR